MTSAVHTATIDFTTPSNEYVEIDWHRHDVNCPTFAAIPPKIAAIRSAIYIIELTTQNGDMMVKYGIVRDDTLGHRMKTHFNKPDYVSHRLKRVYVPTLYTDTKHQYVIREVVINVETALKAMLTKQKILATHVIKRETELIYKHHSRQLYSNLKHLINTQTESFFNRNLR